MKKIFTFFAAALMSVSMSAEMVEFQVGPSALNFGANYPQNILVYGSFTTGDYSVPFLGAKYWNVDDFDANTAPSATADDTFNFAYMDGETKKVLADQNGNECSLRFGDYWVDNYPDGTKKVSIFNYESGWLAENYQWIDAPEPAKYYLVGTMNEWSVDENYELNPNIETEIEEYFYGIELTTTSEFKVVKVENGVQSWFPEGMGNNYGQNGEITEDGEYTVYFRPNYDGGEDWFYGCIYAVRHADPERVVMIAAFPVNGKPENGVQLLTSGSEEPIDLMQLEEGAYINSQIEAEGKDEFGFQDADDEDNYLVMCVSGEWIPAAFVFEEVWADETYKGDPVKMVEIDLSDNSKYAWAKAIPEGLDDITVDTKVQKRIINGQLLIEKNGKLYNAIGAEVK